MDAITASILILCFVEAQVAVVVAVLAFARTIPDKTDIITFDEEEEDQHLPREASYAENAKLYQELVS